MSHERLNTSKIFEQVTKMDEMRQRIVAVMAVVFDINVVDIRENAAPGVIEQWDSMRHMNLVLALEEEFGMRFNDDDVAELITIPLIESIIKESSGSNRSSSEKKRGGV